MKYGVVEMERDNNKNTNLSIRTSCSTISVNSNRDFRTSEADILVLKTKKNASKHESF
jgi:hypothetical protein